MPVMQSIDRHLYAPLKSEQGLYNGDRLTQKSFHRRYIKTSDQFKAELIGGIVYLSSPVYAPHSRPHQRLSGWLSAYMKGTPGIDAFDNTTTVLGAKSEPQPDLALVFLPEVGGKSSLDEKGVLRGPPELVIEVAFSSVSMDLHQKRLDYEKAGVREYIVLLSEKKKFRIFSRHDETLIEDLHFEDGVWKSAVFPGLWLDTNVLFKRSIDPLLLTLERGKKTGAYKSFAREMAREMKRLGISEDV